MDHILASTSDDAIAAEKGRLFACRALIENRKEVEERFEKAYGPGKGIAFLKLRYPEAYQPQPFFRRVVDRLTFRQE